MTTPPPDAPDAPDELLCGALVDDLVEQVAEGGGRTRHQQECAHCSARLDRLAAAWSHVERLRDTAVTASPEFTRRVAARIRRESEGRVTLAARREGSTTVAVGVVEIVASIAAHQVPAVLAVRGSTLAPTSLALSLDVVTSVDEPLAVTADAVRDAVLLHVQEVLGTSLPRIDVRVVDVR